jgi:WD40 repeat protein
MASGWTTVRVFISSTFRDMHAERDHLVRVVFPELRERCRTRHVHLIDVDLRWGVTEADAEDGRALDICLDEIDGCRPYFLGILGHRYGFVPDGHVHSITAQEIYHGVLHGSLPRQVVDLRTILDEPNDGHALSRVEQDCLTRCYRWDANKRKHLLQDTVAPGDADTIRAVFARFARYQKDRSFFFFRSDALSLQSAGTRTGEFVEQHAGDRQKLDALKQEIVAAGLPHFDYADLETFGQLVLNTLWQRIEAETGASPREETDWLGRESELHALLMADRTRRFVGRRDLLDCLHEFCEGDEDPPLLVVSGTPGCGKSALMARFTEEASQRHPDWLLLAHFVGASSGSTSLRQMLRRLCTQLNRAIGADQDAPEATRALLTLFPELLAKASAQRTLVIVIDAVNQLERADHAHAMHWLPQALPGNVRIVISTLAGEAQDAVRQRRLKPRDVTVSGLTASETRELAATYLREIRHEFPNAEVEADFYRKVEAGHPLYILVALEELRVFGTFEELGRRISRLPDNVPALFDQVLERVESDFSPGLVGDCLSYIACGRQGMTAEELQTLLKAHAPRMDPRAEAPKLPDMLWSRLYRSLSAYLFQRSGVVDFFHGQLKDAVGRRYLQEVSRRVVAHRAIADYLDGRWTEPYPRALDELPHQRMRAGDWPAVAKLLGDLQFIELKCRAGMAYDLMADYEAASGSEDVPADARAELEDFGRFAHAQSHVLARNAALTFQQAANEPDSTAPARTARARLEAGREVRPWFQHVNKPQSRSACLMTLEGHAEEVWKCAFSPDGGRIVSAPLGGSPKLWDARTGALLATLAGHTQQVLACAYSADGRRAATASWDWTVRLWDGTTGAELVALSGHTAPVHACAFSPDGNRIVSASLDRTLKLWDVQTGAMLTTLAGHRGEVWACAYSPDGDRIVSASADGTMRFWDAHTGAQLIAVNDPSGSVHACALSPDGDRIVSASGDQTLRLWNARTGIALATLKGHKDDVHACAYSPDGGRIVSASEDKTLRLWDGRTGAKVATLKGHRGDVTACAFSPDSRRIVSASEDKTLKLWDGRTGAIAATLAGHARWVRACAFSPDSRVIVSASEDKTLKLWDGQAGAGSDALAGRTRWAEACMLSPDRGRIVSASEDDNLELWDARTGARLAALEDYRVGVQACVFSPDAQRIVSASGKTLKLWDAQTGAELDTLTGHADDVNACAVSADGTRILSASSDGTLKLWDARTSAELRTLAGHTDGVNACAFSPDGRRIVSASEDATLKLWDAETGAELATLEDHWDCVQSCAFSPDGLRLVSAAGNTLMLWDARTGDELATFEARGDQVHGCAFSPDGRRIVSISGDYSGDEDEVLTLWEAKARVPLWEYDVRGIRNATAWILSEGDLAARDSLGQILILRLRNFYAGPVIVTPWAHQQRVQFGCPRCRVWSGAAASALGTVMPCPRCGEHLKINPFVIDADWRPIAEAWARG